MNIDKLTPQMWEVIRTWDYATITRVSMMMQPLEEDEEWQQ